MLKQLGLAMLAAIATTAQAENLLDIYQQARSNDPIYLAALNQHAAAQEGYVQARAALLPTLGLRFTSSEIDDSISASDSLGEFSNEQASNASEELNLSLTQSIYDYRNWVRLNQAEDETTRADTELLAAEQDLLIRVAEAYFAVLSDHDDFITVQSERKSVEAHHELVCAKKASGLARDTDLYDALARYQEAQAREFEVASRLRDAQQQLRELTGQVPASLQLLGEMPLVRPAPADASVWVSSALEFNPEVRMRQLDVLIAEQEADRQSGGHYPTFDLEVNAYDRTNEGDRFGEITTDGNTISLNMNLPLYQGGSVSSRVREAERLHARTQDQLQLEQRAVQRLVLSSYDGVLTEIAKVEALKTSVDSYARSLEFKKLGYDSGVTTSLTLLDAERDLFMARSFYTRARYGYVLNSLKLKRAAGLLTLKDLEEINALLSGDALPLLGRAPASAGTVFLSDLH